MKNCGACRGVAESATALRAGETTSVELTEAALRCADQLDVLLGAYAARFDEEAMAAARAADRELAAGRDRGPLHGIPVGIKDLLATGEGPTRAGSAAFDPAEVGPGDATAVARLRAAGAVIAGKTTTMEFGLGHPEPADPFPLPRNPWDLGRSPGGSSSGSAVAIAADLLPATLGTDTGGSIRIPASFCGATGLMPTLGRVPTAGCVDLAPSLDRVGPIAGSVADCAIVFAAIAGLAGDALGDLGDGALAGLRIGVDRESLEGAYAAAVRVLEEGGAELVQASLPAYEETVEAGWTTMVAEAFDLHHRRLAERGDDYGADARRLISSGGAVTAAELIDARRALEIGRTRFDSLIEEVDLIATPTTSVAAPRYEQLERSGMTEVLPEIHTMYWNAVGAPALALPIGLDAEGMPRSLQLAARRGGERTLLRAGHRFQLLTDWHLMRPEIDPDRGDLLPFGGLAQAVGTSR